MISLLNGRLLLTCERASQTWHAHIILGPGPEHRLDVDTGTVDLRQAMLRAMNDFNAFRAKARPIQEEIRYCWDCIHWEPKGRGRCSMEFPEARQTGGRFASRCSIYAGANDHQHN